MAHGYTLIGKASRQSPDYVPSLVGVRYQQEEATPDDMYFERIEFDDFAAGCVTQVSRSQWVNFDSFTVENDDSGRDPILEVRRQGGAPFYCPARELIEVAIEIDDAGLVVKVNDLLSGRTR